MVFQARETRNIANASACGTSHNQTANHHISHPKCTLQLKALVVVVLREIPPTTTKTKKLKNQKTPKTQL